MNKERTWIILVVICWAIFLFNITKAEAHQGGTDVCGGHMEYGVYHTHDERKLDNCRRIMNTIMAQELPFTVVIGDDTLTRNVRTR